MLIPSRRQSPTCDRPKVRLFVDADLAEAVVVPILDRQAHYLLHVMRLVRNDQVRLFNGRDGDWLACITSIEKSGCQLRCERQLVEQRCERGPWLLFAPLKKTAMDILVEKSTEIGVARLLPVRTRHTAVDRINVERIRAQVIEAAEQSGRQTLPEVCCVAPLEDVLGEWPTGRRLLFLDEGGGGWPVADAIRAAADDAVSGAMLVGPEGGFGNEEAEMIAAQPFVQRVDLGPRILRAETAAVAVLACWQALAGDWRPPGPPGAAN